MRRLAYAAAVCGTLVLAACSDQTQSPTEPTVPKPSENFGSCTVTPFPLLTTGGVVDQIKGIWTVQSPVRLAALAQAAAVALLWDTCHPSDARKVAIFFVNWIDTHAPDPTSDAVATLKRTILEGVGLTFDPPAAEGDFGIGFFTPGSRLVVNAGGHALVDLPPNAFNEPTTIIVNRKSDDFQLTNFDGQQFPPYWEYDALNASNQHVIQNGQTALIVFCLYYSPNEPGTTPEGSLEVPYPQDRRIGHNPVEGAPGFPFERLEPGTPSAALLSQLHCGDLQETSSEIFIGGFGSGLPGFANAAWRTVGHYLAPVARAVFLPEALAAATLGTLPPPPINGRAPSLSPFGVVEALALGFTNDGGADPGGHTFARNSILSWQVCTKGCYTYYPEVRITDNGSGVNGVPVTVSLVRVGGSTGSFTAGSTTTVTTVSSYEDPGYAQFTNLHINRAGTYQLTFSAPGATPITSGQFTVTQN
jgi:hypothetical protein